MANVTSDQLRDLSVAVVEDFLNNKVPLSQGLAKQAAAAQLNSDQIQRAVEATNTIAYLKVLGMSDDRTVEFPLAKFAEVMRLVTLPEEAEKKAGWEEEKETTNDRPEATADADPFTSQVIVDENDAARREKEKRAYFIKEASANRAALEELEVQALAVQEALVKVAQEVAKDEKGLDKLASIIDGSDYAQLTVLVTGEVKPHRDFGDHQLFKEAELKTVNKLTELFKEAKHIVAEQARRSGLQKRADAVSDQMTKEAGLASSFGKAVGSAIGGAAKAVVTAPAKVVGRSVKNTVGPIASKVTGKPFTPAKGLGLGTALGFAGSVGLDAAMYNPGTDSSTGRSNDVWDALQRS